MLVKDKLSIVGYFLVISGIELKITIEEVSQVGLSLEVIFQDEEAIPRISCTSNGRMPTNIVWGRDGGLPMGVTQLFEFFEPTRQRQKLNWGRNGRYTDSGRYTCSSPSTSVVLELEILVRSEYK